MVKPNDVNKKNEDEVCNTLFDHIFSELPIPEYKVGDTVRISKYKSTFIKGYQASFTEELFKIKRVIQGDPNVYKLEDLDNQ